MGSHPIIFLQLWPATDHEPHCRHLSIKKISWWTESTLQSGWWCNHMAGSYSDCSAHEINNTNSAPLRMQPITYVACSVCVCVPVFWLWEFWFWCRNKWTDWDVVCAVDLCGPGEPCGRWGPRTPHGKGKFLMGAWLHLPRSSPLNLQGSSNFHLALATS